MAIGTAGTRRGCLADFQAVLAATLLYFAASFEYYPQTYLTYRPSRKMSSVPPFSPDYVMDPGHKRAFDIYNVLKCARRHYTLLSVATRSRYISVRAKKCEHLSDLLLHKTDIQAGGSWDRPR